MATGPVRASSSSGSKEFGGDLRGLRAVGFFNAGDVQRAAGVRDDFARLKSLLQVDEIAGSDARTLHSSVRSVFPNHHQFIGVGKGQRVEYDRLYQRKRGGVDADRECEDEHRRDEECRTPSDGAARVAHVLPQTLEGRPTPSFSDVFFDRC